MKDRIARAVFWIVWSRGGVQLVSFLSTIAVARLLQPSDYGLIALLGVWTNTIAFVAEMGLGSALIQFRDLKETELNACFWLTVSLAGLGYLGLFFASPAIAAWFDTPGLSNILRVGGVMPILVALRVVPDSLLRKRLRLDRISQAEIIAAAVSIPLTLTMAWAGAGAWALVAGALSMQLVKDVVSFWFVRWWPGLRVGSTRLRRIFRYSLAMLGSKVCGALYRQADVFVLGKVSGNVVLGFYSMAKQLAVLPVNKVATVVNQLATPVMAELQAQREAMASVLLRGLRQVGCLTIPLCMGLMLMADDLVLIALTNKWATAVPVLRVLCLYAVVSSLEVLLRPALMARYRAGFLLGYSITLLGIMPVAFWVGANLSGAVGVAVAWAVVYPIVVVWLVREALRETELSWKTLWAQLRAPAAATLVMMSVIILGRSVFSHWIGDVPIARLAAAILLGALAYGATLSVIGPEMLEEFRETLGWVFRRRVGIASANSTAA